ncbi:tetratricopeptide repeat protein [Cellulophaga lytica]|nr:tetratricopeptide repeat protein [Cellulophaga lytica]
MKMKKIAILLCFMGMSIYGYSQKTEIYTNKNKDYVKALSLYNDKQYQASQAVFKEVAKSTDDYETKANSYYYIATAAIRLNQLGADKLMEQFVEDYPTSTKRNTAYLDVADYYFETGKYPHALKWYAKVDQSSMSRKDKERFEFNNGYALFSSKKYKDAERYLNRVTNSATYGSQAKYYLGYIAYEQDNYQEANERFDQITDQDELKEKLSYYQADMNFKLGNFEKAIALAKEQLPKADRNEVSELNKIIGESYFNLKQYNNAIPYLTEYKGKRGKWSNTDYYLLGYSYYKQGDYANGIDQFNNIIDGDNSVSQNAYYHLAECYLKLDKKQEALNAFKNAAQMDYSEEIKKDAYLNYARLSYEIGNAYEPVPSVLTKYLETYPNTEHTKEIQELLVDSYITSKNYKGALELLEKNKNYASKETYQKVAFYRGVELFLEQDYESSLKAFNLSLDNAEEPKFKARANFWKAESLYLLNKFDDALVSFVAFQQNPMSVSTDENKELDYNLAYTYFKLNDYVNATSYYKKYTDSKPEDEAKLNDAYLRLGDCYFVTSKYWPAIETYNIALKNRGGQKDYAAYQRALSYGFVGKSDTKIDELKSFVTKYNKSTLKDDALYELGNTYIKLGNEDLGLQAYNKLIEEYKGSSLVPRALLRQGLVHYNASRNEQALAKFKTVVRDHAKTQEAIQAVATAKLVYVDLGRVDEYANWVRDLDFVEVTDSELDNATYESAEKQFIENKTDAAIKGYENYIKEFPNGSHILDANFKLAQLYFAKGQKVTALPHYKYVADQGGTEFTEQAIARVCEIYIADNKYTDAFPYLEKLEQTANIKQNVTFAQSNLMKGYYNQKNYSKTIAYAEKVLATESIDNRIKSDAHIMIARSAIKTNNEPKAKEAYAIVQKIATGERGAEAWYYNAYFKHKEQEYEGSSEAVQTLVKDFSGYKEWAGKGLLIMAKNYYALGDAYQANYILENIIKNFGSYPDIVAEAQTEQRLIKTKESRSNSSINPDGN